MSSDTASHSYLFETLVTLNTKIEPGFECPGCGEDEMGRLRWNTNGKTISCFSCKNTYNPYKKRKR